MRADEGRKGLGSSCDKNEIVFFAGVEKGHKSLLGDPGSELHLGEGGDT